MALCTFIVAVAFFLPVAVVPSGESEGWAGVYPRLRGYRFFFKSGSGVYGFEG